MKQPLNLKRLRLMVDDPAGDNEKFTDGDYIEMYESHENINCLAAEIWLLKAGELQSVSMSGVKSYKVGDESYTMTDLKDLYTHAMVMHEKYADMCKSTIDDNKSHKVSGSFIFGVQRPNVL